MLARVPEDRSLALGRHGRIGDRQFPVLAAAVARAELRLLQMGMIGKRLDEAQIVGVGVPGAQANLRLAGRSRESHRADPARDMAVDPFPRLSRRLNVQEVTRGHAAEGIVVGIGAAAVVRKVQVERDSLRFAAGIAANQIDARHGVGQNAGPFLRTGANPKLARRHRHDPTCVTRRPPIRRSREKYACLIRFRTAGRHCETRHAQHRREAPHAVRVVFPARLNANHCVLQM